MFELIKLLHNSDHRANREILSAGALCKLQSVPQNLGLELNFFSY